MGIFDLFRRPPPTKLGLRKGFTFTPIDASERSGLLPRSLYNYEAAVRSGLDSNVVMAPVQWTMRTFPEAELIAERKEEGQWRKLTDGHPAVDLIDNPNAFYGGDELLQAICLSWFMDGNAYILPSYTRLLEPVELWYVPHWLIEPKWSMDGSEFISHYEYTPDGKRIEIAPDRLIHLRFGLDPRNPRKGLSPIKTLFREVFTDEEAANFSSSILRNMGVPGVVISPRDWPTAVELQSDPEKREELKKYIDSHFTGDKRGSALVLGAPTDVKQFAYSPNELMLGNLRDIAEERVCALIGIQPAVVGFGSGLQATKVGATMAQLVRLAWLSCMIPTQRLIAKQMTRQLLSQLDSQADRTRLRFDTSRVSAFQEEETEKATRITKYVEKGVLRVDRAQEMAGFEVDPTQAVYLRPSNALAIDAEGQQVGGDTSADLSIRNRLRDLITDASGNGGE